MRLSRGSRTVERRDAAGRGSRAGGRRAARRPRHGGSPAPAAAAIARPPAAALCRPPLPRRRPAERSVPRQDARRLPRGGRPHMCDRRRLAAHFLRVKWTRETVPAFSCFLFVKKSNRLRASRRAPPILKTFTARRSTLMFESRHVNNGNALFETKVGSVTFVPSLNEMRSRPDRRCESYAAVINILLLYGLADARCRWPWERCPLPVRRRSGSGRLHPVCSSSEAGVTGVAASPTRPPGCACTGAARGCVARDALFIDRWNPLPTVVLWF